MRKILSLAFTLILVAALILPTFADGWYCPDCGRYNDSNFCPKDGTKKPADLGTNASQSGRANRLRSGDVICLGTYEQDNRGGQEEAIEWIVLETSGNNALLLSRYGLEAKQPFLDRYAACTWETSTLRQWLNSDFLDGAFTSSEEDCILETWVDNGKSQGNPNWSTVGGGQHPGPYLPAQLRGSGYLFQNKRSKKMCSYRLRPFSGSLDLR